MNVNIGMRGATIFTACIQFWINQSRMLKSHVELINLQLTQRKNVATNVLICSSNSKIDNDANQYSLDWDSDNYGKDNERKFIDWMKIKVRAGNGGNGMSHLKKRRLLQGPDGGDGGKGGDVIIQAEQSRRQLRGVKRQYKAPDGGKGQTDHCRGKDGKHVVIQVPVGTVITDSTTKTIIADLNETGNSHVVAKGGVGGLGNTNFKSSTNQAPTEATPGEDGENAVLELEMRSIADVGLVGFPNAGKSTLLRALSRAKPAVAAYPFTTLKPNIGIIQFRDYLQIAVADIPGLVEDAHINKGLGHAFLRHIERCSSLLYVVDSSENNLIHDFNVLKNEVKLYNKELLSLPAALVANKIDLVENYEEKIDTIEKELNIPVIAISGKHLMNIEKLREIIRTMVDGVNKLKK
eukprot:Seg378.14 transcript_id=Seg378.14/GoldUCD/mRNA.D3Y31 product="GTPase Obg" protein_id=Seg378.14/GoldUCD/D3Y31